MSYVVDTSAPGTIEDIEYKTPRSEHTGNARRLLVIDTPHEERLTTTTARRSVPMAARRVGDIVVTQADGEDNFYFLSYLHSRLFEAGLVRHARELPSRLTIQLSGRAQNRLLRLVTDRRWENLMTNLGEISDLVVSEAEPPSDAIALTSTEAPRADVSVAALAQQLRDLIDLPVQDLARMCGVRRRQFYNLLNGESQPPPAQERRIRELLAMVRRLYASLDQKPGRVRAAILTPLGDNVGSFYDAAGSGDLDRMQSVFGALLAATGQGATARQVLPPSGRVSARDATSERAVDLLRSRGSESMSHEALDER